jgi:hypothetical protein
MGIEKSRVHDHTCGGRDDGIDMGHHQPCPDQGKEGSQG